MQTGRVSQEDQEGEEPHPSEERSVVRVDESLRHRAQIQGRSQPADDAQAQEPRQDTLDRLVYRARDG